jgi:hypothetical protein
MQNSNGRFASIKGQPLHERDRPLVADHRLTKSVPIDPEKPFRFTNRGRSTNKINALAECPVLDSLRSRSANEI